jgi:hypothetical protein
MHRSGNKLHRSRRRKPSLTLWVSKDIEREHKIARSHGLREAEATAIARSQTRGHWDSHLSRLVAFDELRFEADRHLSYRYMP